MTWSAMTAMAWTHSQGKAMVRAAVYSGNIQMFAQHVTDVGGTRISIPQEQRRSLSIFAKTVADTSVSQACAQRGRIGFES